jgi:hypothetical protein
MQLAEIHESIQRMRLENAEAGRMATGRMTHLAGGRHNSRHNR